MGTFKINILPEGFTQVEYLESTDTQYIDTGYSPIESTFGFNIDFSIEDDDSPSFAFGMRDLTTSTQNQWWYIQYEGIRSDWDLSSDYTYKLININQKYNITANPNKFDIDGETWLNTSRTKTTTSRYSIYLFAVNIMGKANGIGNQRIYRCKLYEGDTTVRDLIPALDPNNVPCMYDLITKQALYNKGTGDFAYGDVVPKQTPKRIKINGKNVVQIAMNRQILPDEYQLVTYLQTTGKCLIVTDQVPSFNIAMHIKFRAQTGSNYLFQARDTNGVFGISGSLNNNTLILSNGTTTTGSVMNRVANNIYEAIGTISDSNLVLDVTNITNKYHNIVEAKHTDVLKTTANICLFGNTTDNYIASGVRIYYAGIKDIITNKNKCFYYPCLRKSDNKPGMYDTVSGKFFTNQGTGEFITGPVVPQKEIIWTQTSTANLLSDEE